MASMLTILFWALAAIVLRVDAIPTISAVGSKFFTSDGDQWYIKGVAYQLIEDDPLVNTEQCQRDAALMKQLGANAIRVYHVNETGDHSGCMNAFAEAGIYAFIDLDSFKTYIRYADVSSWTHEKSNSYRAIMDNFQQYDNVAGFLVGNEVLNTLADAPAAPYLLSAAADMKTYRDAKRYRKIPIGYSATDTAVLRPMLHDYLVCRPNETERLDFYALNSYEWCGDSATYLTSGYQSLQKMFESYPIPVFLSEDGCNTVPPRTFNDQAAIFGQEMSGTWSGAIIYEWIQEMNQYGLVSYGPQQAADVNEGNNVIQGFTRNGVPTPVSPDFSNLQAQWAAITPSGVASNDYVAKLTTQPPACPTFDAANGWNVDPSSSLPVVGAAGVTPGMPSGVPTGSITVSVNTNVTSAAGAPTASTSLTYVSSGNPSTTSEGASSATSEGAAGKTASIPISINDVGFTGMVVALIAVGVGVMILL